LEHISCRQDAAQVNIPEQWWQFSSNSFKKRTGLIIGSGA